jgi:hypothetical protein
MVWRDAHIQHTLAPPSMSTRDRWSHHWSDGLDQSKESISNITNKYIYKFKILKTRKLEADFYTDREEKYK